MKATNILGGRIAALSAAALLALGSIGADGLSAQQDISSDLTQLQEHHPELARMLEAVDVINHTIFETILSGGSDRQTYDRLVREILANPAWQPTMASQEMAAAMGSELPIRVVDALERANGFHHELLNIYANPAGVAGAFREVQQLVNRYTSDPETAFLVDPKDMMITTEGDQAGAFGEAYPNLQGLFWANRWLQLAAFEPLIRYSTVHQRAAGISAVIARYWYILSDPPESFPTEMPMAPTIAPTLVAYHPQAAAVLDNSYMFQDLTADVFASQSIEDEGSWLDQLLVDFQTPDFMWTSWYDWNRMAILHGVGNQGGWATGIIPDPKQTQLQLNHEGHDMEGGHLVIPGMPGPGM